MDKIRDRLKNIKQSILRQAGEDKELRKVVKNAINEIFINTKNPLQYVKEFYFKKEKLYITTTNKSFANELLLKKERLVQNFIKLKIKEVIIK